MPIILCNVLLSLWESKHSIFVYAAKGGRDSVFGLSHYIY